MSVVRQYQLKDLRPDFRSAPNPKNPTLAIHDDDVLTHTSLQWRQFHDSGYICRNVGTFNLVFRTLCHAAGKVRQAGQEAGSKTLKQRPLGNLHPFVRFTQFLARLGN